MHLFATLIFTSLSFFVEATPTLSSPGFAVPISQRTRVGKDANGFDDVTKLQGSVGQSIAKLNRGFQAYEKNTGARHPSAPELSHSKKRSTGSDPLVDLKWYGNISVGTPTMNFTVNIDTGSSDLFLPSPTCDSTCAGHALYDPSKSSSEHDLGTSFYLQYDDNSGVKGTLYTDDVTIAGYTATNQTFGAATSYSAGFSFPGWVPDGLLGLGFPSISGYGATPVFHTLVAEDVLPSNSFGLCPTELYIGGTNSQHYQGDFTYVKVTQEGYWQTNIDALYLSGQKVASTIPTIIDSGTAMILGDNQTVQAFYDQIPGSSLIGSGYYSIPCTFDSDIAFQFGSTRFVIPPKTFNFGTYSSDTNACVGAFVANDDLGLWVLGVAFLETVYVEFDVGNKRIGFATPA